MAASIYKLFSASYFKPQLFRTCSRQVVCSYCAPVKGVFPENSQAVEDELDDILKDRAVDMPIENLANPFEKEKKQCVLCKYKVKLDYKNTKLLSQFVSPFTGKVYSKHITGLCETQYKRVQSCIAISRSCGFMPYMYKDLTYIKDPKICIPGNFKKKLN